MMQVFDNLRAILTRHKENMPVVTTAEMLAEIDEEEAKFGGGWIPCSERLPNWNEYQKNDGRFIVTDGNRVYQSIFDIYANSGFRTLKLFHFVGGTQTASFEVDNCVIAWQPLPAPYQKGE